MMLCVIITLCYIFFLALEIVYSAFRHRAEYFDHITYSVDSVITQLVKCNRYKEKSFQCQIQYLFIKIINFYSN